MSTLQEKLKNLPAAPGVYFHKNQAGEIIYIGKAAVLKNRVRQYFQKNQKDAKTTALVAEITDIDWIVVDTEMDALFLESEMIKRYQPKWNILLRDDKTVSYVRIDLKSPVPHVSITRTPMDDQATYIGPFYSKVAVQKALRILRKVFPFYDRPFKEQKTLYTDLGLTPGLEIGATTVAEYRKDLRQLIRYLKGDRQKLMRDLEAAMEKAAQSENYELATKLRNQLFSLKALKQKIVFSDQEFLDLSNDQALRQLQNLLRLSDPPRRIEGYDISHHAGEHTVASMVVFSNGVADRSEYRKFRIRSSTNDDVASLREVLTRRFKHRDWTYPDLIILDGSTGQLSAVRDLVAPLQIPIIGRDKSGSHSHGGPVKITFLLDRQYQTLALPDNHHVARLVARIDEEAHRFAVTYHSLLKRQSMLK